MRSGEQTLARCQVPTIFPPHGAITAQGPPSEEVCEGPRRPPLASGSSGGLLPPAHAVPRTPTERVATGMSGIEASHIAPIVNGLPPRRNRGSLWGAAEISQRLRSGAGSVTLIAAPLTRLA